MQLTEEQRRIVRHKNGHALVSAVAGSGKTTTMVARVQQLLEQGCAPRDLLVLMFNRSARDSFAEALNRRLDGTGLAVPDVRTYHSLGLRLVESFTRKGVLPAYKLVTDERIREKLAKQALNSAYKEENGDHAWATKEDLEEFLRFIDLVKAGIVTSEQCFEQENIAGKCSYFIEAFKNYEQGRCGQRIRFYEDLVHEPLMAMLQDRNLATWVSNRVEQIIVDEYQDINEVQQQLLKILAGSRAKVMVVGDVDQCIYEWRGARPEYITSRFQHDFPAPSRYLLSYTFRYGHRLSLAANHLISRNQLRDRKLCLSAPTNFDTRITLYEEADRHPILKIVAEWLDTGRMLDDAAVLVRLFGMSVPLELALLDADIPYRLQGHEQVFECREVKALIGYLKLCSGDLEQEDQQARTEYLIAMLSQPHLGVRQEEIEKLAAQIAVNPREAPTRILWQMQSEMPAFIKKKIAQTSDDWQWLMRRSVTGRADLLLTEIISRLDLYEFFGKFSSRQATAENRIETCRSFVDFAARQKLNTKEFLEKLEALKKRAGSRAGDGLLITSVHRAKGLEWPLVVIPGLKDGSFPFVAGAGEGAAENLEDERRLFYVAVTRGIEKVALIHPPDSTLSMRIAQGFGSAPVETRKASRFLFEANLGLSERVGDLIMRSSQPGGAEVPMLTAVDIQIANDYLQAVNAGAAPVGQAEQATRIEPEKKQHTLRISDLEKGVMVHHRVFGEGKIVEVLGRSQGRIRVRFEEHGEKTLILSFAPLTLRR